MFGERCGWPRATTTSQHVRMGDYTITGQEQHEHMAKNATEEKTQKPQQGYQEVSYISRMAARSLQHPQPRRDRIELNKNSTLFESKSPPYPSKKKAPNPYVFLCSFSLFLKSQAPALNTKQLQMKEKKTGPVTRKNSKESALAQVVTWDSAHQANANRVVIEE